MRRKRNAPHSAQTRVRAVSLSIQHAQEMERNVMVKVIRPPRALAAEWDGILKTDARLKRKSEARQPDPSVRQAICDRRVPPPIDTLHDRARPPLHDAQHDAGKRLAADIEGLGEIPSPMASAIRRVRNVRRPSTPEEIGQAKDDQERMDHDAKRGFWAHKITTSSPAPAPVDQTELICGAAQNVARIKAALPADEFQMLRDLIVDEWGVESLALRWCMRRAAMRAWIGAALWRLSDVYSDIDADRTDERAADLVAAA